MDTRYRLRLALTFAMVGSAGATVLLLVVLVKAAIDRQIAAYPAKAALIALFILIFGVFGAFNAILYRRLNRKGLQAGGPVD